MTRKKCSVLVVDDNKDVADTLAMFVAVLGHEVHQVYDGHSAILNAEALRPDLVFLDLGMPDPNGFAVAHQLLQSPNLPLTRIVAVTGHGDDASIERAFAGGFTDYLLKPYVAEELRRLLDRPPSRPKPPSVAAS